MTASAPPLRDALEDYLMLRRALGFKLASAARLLGQFVSYLEARGTSTVTTSDALAWATLPAGASSAWQAIRLSVVRGFAAYLHGIDPSVQVPPAGLIRRGNDRATPYLYSDAEIGALIAAAAGLRPRLRAATYQTLVGLLAVSVACSSCATRNSAIMPRALLCRVLSRGSRSAPAARTPGPRLRSARAARFRCRTPRPCSRSPAGSRSWLRPY